MTTRKLREHDPDRLRAVARIIGPQGAAARALEKYDELASNGDDVAIYEVIGGRDCGSLMVGPRFPVPKLSDPS